MFYIIIKFEIPVQRQTKNINYTMTLKEKKLEQTIIQANVGVAIRKQDVALLYMILPFQGMCNSYIETPTGLTGALNLIDTAGDSYVNISVGCKQPVFQYTHLFESALFEKVLTWRVCYGDIGIEQMDF